MAAPEGEPKWPGLNRISRGGEYWEEFEDRTQRKRVMPRLDGAPAPEVIQLVREVGERLSILGGYVGLGPRGSRWLGHALPTSDYDMTVLMDSSDPHFDRKMANGIAREVRDEWAKKEKKKNVHFDYADMAGIKNDTDLSRFGVGHNAALAALGGDVVGPEVEKYRRIAHEKLMNLSPETRERVLRNAAELRLDQEGTRTERVEERINGNIKKKYSPSAVRSGRAEAWHRKIFKAFDIPSSSDEATL